MNVNAETLYQECLTSFKDVQLPDLFCVLLREACETAVNSSNPGLSNKQVALIAFDTSLLLFKATIEAALQQADIVNLNYLNQQFQIDKNHPILQYRTIL